MNGLARKLLLSLLISALVVALAEGALRLVGPPPEARSLALGPKPGAWSVPDPLFGWRLRPGARMDEDPVRRAWEARWGLPHGEAELPINSIGMRDVEVELPKPDDELRYLCMGDSSVFGSGVPRRDTFAERLEARLNEGGATPRVQVLNGGVPAWTTYQSILQLRAVLPYGLDGAVVYNMLSDLMMLEAGTPDYIYFPVAERLQLARGLTRLFLYRWLDHLVGLHRPPPRPAAATRRVPLPYYRQNLRRIVQIARDHDLDLVFVIPPVAGDLDHPPRDDYVPDDQGEAQVLSAALIEAEARDSSQHTQDLYRMAMAVEAFRAGIPLVDGPRVFREAWLAHPDRYTGAHGLFVDSLHPSSEGHALLAEAIQPHLEAAVAARRSR